MPINHTHTHTHTHTRNTNPHTDSYCFSAVASFTVTSGSIAAMALTRALTSPYARPNGALLTRRFHKTSGSITLMSAAQRMEGEGVAPAYNVLGMDLQCCCSEVCVVCVSVCLCVFKSANMSVSVPVCAL